MKFLNLRIDNVFSFDKAEVKLEDRNLCLVSGYSRDEGGSNGAGKSSLVNHALIWGLFGMSPNGIRGDDVVNKNTGRSKASVEIDFEVNDTIYRITRSRHPSELKLHTYVGSLFAKSSDGWSDISHRLSEETQKTIESLIGRNFTSFTQADFFGQGDRVSSFPSLTPSAQREVLEDILPIRQLDVWASRAGQARKGLGDLIGQNRLDLNRVDSLIEEVGSSRIKLADSDARWRNDKAKKIDDLKKQIEKVGENVRHFEQVKAQTAEMLERLGEVEDTEEIAQKISDLRSQDTEMATAMDESTTRNHEWCKKVVAIQAQIKSIPINTCPTCGQEVDKELTDKLNDEQAGFKKELEDAKGMAGEWENRKREYEKNKLALAEPIRLWTHELAMIQERNSQREQYASKLASMEGLRPTSTEYLESQLSSLEASNSPFAPNLEDIDKRLTELYGEKKDLEVFLMALEKDMTPVSMWEEAFKKDIKNALFQRACSFLNVKSKEHLEKLNNPQFHVEFSTSKELKSGDSREELNVKCWSDSGGKSYAHLSSGEKQIISFAIGMALSDLALTQVETECNLMILDEPFVCLDPRNCENIVNYLTSELSKSRTSIFLISNEDSLKALIPDRIHVIKQNGVSKLEDQ